MDRLVRSGAKPVEDIPEPVLTALDLLDARPAEAAFVGDSPFDVAAGKGLEVAVTTALGSGQANRALEGQPEEKIAASIASIRKALTPLQRGDTVPLGASVWIVTASNP